MPYLTRKIQAARARGCWMANIRWAKERRMRDRLAAIEPAAQKKPLLVTMKTVELRQCGPCCGTKPRKERGEVLGPWLYWTWEGYSCGYAGMKDEGEHARGAYLLMEERRAA